MNRSLLALTLALLAQPGPIADDVQRTLVERGLAVGGVSVTLPRPSFGDGQDPASSRAALRAIVGDDRSVENFLRDSVTAPFVLKMRDVKAEKATVRVADVWFAVRGHLEDVDLKQVLGSSEERTAEAGNMRFATKILTEAEVAERKLDRPPSAPGRDEWSTRTRARLLDRIELEVTARVVATRTADSITVASVAYPTTTGSGRTANHWATISRSNGVDTVGPPQGYVGGGSYAKITRLAAEPEVLLVEGHFAFVEPDPWFDGNPILRSKIALICQDQIRQLRREIQKRRAGG